MPPRLLTYTNRHVVVAALGAQPDAAIVAHETLQSLAADHAPNARTGMRAPGPVPAGASRPARASARLAGSVKVAISPTQVLATARQRRTIRNRALTERSALPALPSALVATRTRVDLWRTRAGRTVSGRAGTSPAVAKSFATAHPQTTRVNVPMGSLVPSA